MCTPHIDKIPPKAAAILHSIPILHTHTIVGVIEIFHMYEGLLPVPHICEILEPIFLVWQKLVTNLHM